MAIRAVIFDCDGVLVDSVGLADEVLALYLCDLGFAVTQRDAAACFGSGKLASSIASFESERGRKLPSDFENELRRRRELVFRERLRAVEGADELVDRLAVPSCVASNGPQAQIEHSLRVVGLLDRFEPRIFSAYTVQAWKPDPRLFLHAATALGVSAGDCAVVEDTELGLRAALAAGMQAFAFMPQAQAAPSPEVELLTRLEQLLAFLPPPRP